MEYGTARSAIHRHSRARLFGGGFAIAVKQRRTSKFSTRVISTSGRGTKLRERSINFEVVLFATGWDDSYHLVAGQGAIRGVFMKG